MKDMLLEIFTWWNSQTVGTRFFTWRKGEKVGEDALGNVYYRERDGGPRRWVVYNGLVDGSRITPAWHAWMHHRTDEIPPEGSEQDYSWEKPYEPNMTGTAQAYRPPGSILTPEKRPDVTGDYDAWTP